MFNIGYMKIMSDNNDKMVKVTGIFLTFWVNVYCSYGMFSSQRSLAARSADPWNFIFGNSNNFM